MTKSVTKTMKEMETEIDSLKFQVESSSGIFIHMFEILSPGKPFVNFDALVKAAKIAMLDKAQHNRLKLAVEYLRQTMIARQNQICDGYHLGFFNGLELAMSMLERREPVYKDATDIID